MAVGYFDGGSSQRRGSGGYVCFDTRGAVYVGMARWYDHECPTNNTAEMQALVDLLSHVRDAGVPQGARYLLVYGDS